MKILLIEDRQSDARLIKELLIEYAQHQPELRWCQNLSTGLAELTDGPLDVVLLDLSLPDSHGLETLYRVQGEAAGVPIVVLTGNDEEALAIKAVRHGAQDYLTKADLNAASLWRALSYAVERARTLARWEESHRLIQQAPGCVYVYDIREWKLAFSNREFTRLLGIGDDYAAGRETSLRELVHPEDFTAFQQQRRGDILNNDGTLESRYRIKTAGQSWRWIETRESVYTRNNAGLPELVVGAGHVLSDAALAQKSQTREYDLLRTIADSLPEAIFVKNTSGQFLYANTSQLRILGAKTKAEVIGKSDFEFLPRPLAQACKEREEQVLRSARMDPEREEPWPVPGGGEGWRTVTRAPLRDSQGRVTGLLGISKTLRTSEKPTQGAATDASSVQRLSASDHSPVVADLVHGAVSS